jgi:DNA-binding transcriptional MerR regulator
MDRKPLRIGEVARACGVSVDTVRHYERIGVLRKPPRTEAGYRVYSHDAIDRVRLVRSAVQFGFSLSELATFLRARDKGAPPCRAVRAAAQQIMERVEAQIADLLETREWMRSTLDAWDQRLARTGPGAPAHLLEDLPPTFAVSRPRRGRRSRLPPEGGSH